MRYENHSVVILAIIVACRKELPGLLRRIAPLNILLHIHSLIHKFFPRHYNMYVTIVRYTV